MQFSPSSNCFLCLSFKYFSYICTLKPFPLNHLLTVRGHSIITIEQKSDYIQTFYNQHIFTQETRDEKVLKLQCNKVFPNFFTFLHI